MTCDPSPRRRPVRCRLRRIVLMLAPALVLALSGCATPTAVQQEPPAQSRLESRVKVALVEDPELEAAAIFVEARGRRIRLSGFVDTAAQRERAATLAAGVAGVRGVESRIRIR